MTKLEYLNKKVKEVDERFYVTDQGAGVTHLFFNGYLYCFVDCDSDSECDLGVNANDISLKLMTNQPLTEEEQLILKGVKVFYEVCNQPKEYFIWMNYEFTPYGDQCLNLSLENLSYTFDDDIETPGFQTKFTEEEIAEMPTEIQKAIECGFLVKEEVDE